ncbi:MAG: sulfatase-like hydrolase/transferase [Patescibacteria group bacterium]|jgi:hypothetical protein
MKKDILFHPWLFVLIPIISLFENNQDIATAQYLPKPIIISLLGASVLFFTINIIIKNKYKSSIISSIIIISFFYFYSFSDIFFVLDSYLAQGLIFYQSLALVVYVFTIIALGFVIAYSTHKFDNTNKLLNFFAGVIVILQVFNIANYQYQHQGSIVDQINFKDQQAGENSEIKNVDNLPDVYYIILDGYARQDVLKDIYNYDNSDFINFLKTKGFFVADDSTSNYNQTFLSLASTLNINYLDEVATKVGHESSDRAVLKKLISDNTVNDFFKAKGYTFVSLPSTWVGTYKNIKSDIYLANNLRQNDFEALLVKKTPLFLFSSGAQVKDIAIYIETFLDKIPEIASIEAPTFSYIHILSPHPPFIFESNGQVADIATTCLDGTDGSYYFDVCPGGVEKYQKQYVSQLSYLNKRFENIINKILTTSKTPPIIILQSDHGPGSMLDWDSLKNSNTVERMSILNAYYVPVETKKMLYPSITPVNTFRVLFNSVFGANFEILEDKNYFATWGRPYDFVDVTSQVK